MGVNPRLGGPHDTGDRIKCKTKAVPDTHCQVGSWRIHAQYHTGVHIVCYAWRINILKFFVLQWPIPSGIAYYGIHLTVRSGDHRPAVVIRVGGQLHYSYRIRQGMSIPHIPLYSVGCRLTCVMGDRIIQINILLGSGYTQKPHLADRYSLHHQHRVLLQLPVTDQHDLTILLRDQHVAISHKLYSGGAAAELGHIGLKYKILIVYDRFGGGMVDRLQ